MTSYTERSTFHTGKKHKNGVVYSVNHNSLEKGRERQKHINPEKFHENVYHYYCVKSGEMIEVKGGSGGVDLKKHEKEYYKEMFQEGLKNQNERYKKDRHNENCKTLTQFMKSKPPMEIMTEIGNVKSKLPLDQRGEILQAATIATFKELQKVFGNNIQVLSQVFHADEGLIDDSKISYANHMHTRLVFFVDGKDQSRDKEGNPIYNENGDPVMCKVINQTKALEEMGFGIPKYKKGMTLEEMTEAVRNPENWGKHTIKTELYRMVQENPELLKHTKVCSPVVAFTDSCRDYFNRQVEHQSYRLGIDLKIEREPINKSYRKLIKDGKIDLSHDVIPDLDRPYLNPEDYKAAREEERTRVAIQQRDQALKQNMELLAENRNLRAENEAEEERSIELFKQAQMAELQTREAKEKAAAAKAKADQEENRILQAEEYRKTVYGREKNVKCKIFEEIPEVPEKRGLGGKLKAPAIPRKYIVNADQFDYLKELSQYNVHRDYGSKFFKDFKRELQTNDVQDLKEQLETKDMMIRDLQKDLRKANRKLRDHEYYLQKRGLDQDFNEFGYSPTQHRGRTI